MGIHALPPSSVRTLTSTQTLTTPPSLIKELVENSIDAGSTVISIEVSNNCIDQVQVKDNGQGILPGEDRECVAKRWWTSKITKWEDLVQWRGEGGSLGFRGEALASAAEMAGTLTITTRVDGEKVGAVCLYDRQGTLISQSSRSVPVGTTVKVTDFLRNLPVRRQTAIRSSVKHVAQIRRTLVTYALSRPSIRFSLRVLPPGTRGNAKAGGGAGENWIYSPSKTVAECVMKIFGNELASNCTWVESQSDGSGKRNVRVNAFLVKPGIDPSNLNKFKNVNLGAGGNNYVFVDSRPISCSRPGPFKSLLSLYKKYLKAALTQEIGTSDPFIYLSIICSAGLYDPNIEPAKDDVLFENWDRDILVVVNSVFKELYGELESEEKESRTDKGKGKQRAGFDVLLARKPPPQVDLYETAQAEEGSPDAPEEIGARAAEIIPRQFDILIQETAHDEEFADAAASSGPLSKPIEKPSTPAAKRKRRSTWLYNMMDEAFDTEDEEAAREHLPSPPSEALQEPETISPKDNVHLSNPWVIAKINASSLSPVRERTSRVEGGLTSGLSARSGLSASPTTSSSPVNPLKPPNYISPKRLSTDTVSHLREHPATTKFAGPNGPNGVHNSNSTNTRLRNSYISNQAPSPLFAIPYPPQRQHNPQHGSLDAYIVNGAIERRKVPVVKRRKLVEQPDDDIFENEESRKRFLRDADDEELLGMLFTQPPPAPHGNKNKPNQRNLDRKVGLFKYDDEEEDEEDGMGHVDSPPSISFAPINTHHRQPPIPPSSKNPIPNPIPSPPSKFKIQKSDPTKPTSNPTKPHPLPLEHVPPRYRVHTTTLNIPTPSVQVLEGLLFNSGGGYGAKYDGITEKYNDSAKRKGPFEDKYLLSTVLPRFFSSLIASTSLATTSALEQDSTENHKETLSKLRGFSFLKVSTEIEDGDGNQDSENRDGNVGILRARWA